MKSPFITLLLCTTFALCHAKQDSLGAFFPQQNQLTFYLLDVESGLSHNYVNSIEQDSLGFIWIGTMEGLSRYDGHSFEVYRKNNQNRTDGPINNYIQHIKRSDQQELILATPGGLSVYDPKTDQFRHITTSAGLLEDDVTYSAESTSGKLALAIYGGGVQILENNKISDTYLVAPEATNAIPSEKITSLAFQGDSVLWVGTFDEGLSKIDLALKKVTSLQQSDVVSQNINCLYNDPKGNLWIGTGEGIQVVTHHGDTLSLPATHTTNLGLSDDNVLCFEKGPFGNLWAGTRNGGLTIIPTEQFIADSDMTTSWFLPKGDGSSVFNRTVSSLKLAADGNMWIGTSTGINVVNPNGDPIQLIQQNLASEQTISHDRIGAITESANNKIWIGTDGGGLDLYDPSIGQFRHFEHRPTDPYSLSNNYIISLLESDDDKIWAGTYQGGLNLLDPTTGACKKYLQGQQEDGNDVRVIFQDSKKQLWVGTNRGGLYRYHPPIDDFDYVRQIGKIDIRDITEDNHGNLWLATYSNGIIRYNYLTGEKEHFDASTVFGFPGNVIFSLHILENGEVLAGTRYEGLIKLNPTQKTVAAYTEKDGLSNNTINSITPDQEGKLWLGTSNGISFFDPNTNTVGNLNGYNNIQRSEFNIGAAMASTSGKIYLGGNKGINVFRPDNLQQSNSQYPLVFTDLRLMNKKVSAKDLASSAKNHSDIPYLNKIQLNYSQSLFSLDFVALKYPKANDIQYAYKLEPYHDHWIETQQLGTANLSNIPPGEYTLKVRARSNKDDDTENQLAIVISPPFWKTWPAYLIYLVVFSGLIWAGMKYYSDRLKLKNSLLFEKKQRQLEHELNEERVSFFTGFSHELKTPLTLIMAPLEDMLMDVKNPSHVKGLKLIQKNAKYLMEMINRLLEFRKTELDSNQLNLENHRIVKPIKQWVDQYQHLARHRNIKLTGKFPKREFSATIDLEKLHIIVNNLISNALKYCRPKDTVMVTLSDQGDSFVIHVKDTGPGIVKEDHEKVFNWYYQSGSHANHKGTGIGLALTKRLINDHHGSIKLNSQVNQGSEFIVSLPKSQKTATDLNFSSIGEIHLNEIAHPTPAPKPSFDLKKDKNLALLIDDNTEILNYLANLLHEDYDLIYAQNGQEGLEKAVQYIPDIILSDIMMPEKNGIDLCGQLKTQQATTHIPIILLSAKDNVESITSGYGEGADAYITKPFNGQILKSRIANLLSTKLRLRDYYLGKKESANSLSESQLQAVTKEKEFLIQLKNQIIGQLAEETTDVETICQLMGMSRTSLFRKLKAITGQNINQFTRTVKIEHAAYLIREKNLGVAQASFEVGFSSPKYFRKLFKEQLGYLPSEIPKELKQE
ncbi:hybrid sensor histidine kinase/response regulator [Echinicola strongylocentroti]|uniref:histidine kinase n=1 Tax=Echinicola strongylocentroti TaxID=1795355 RepID=A0A2Z4IPN7_9BACT|nr:two-component regulator propeller domain-containing protein [Echinicola strongylocentroti]AWW32679.1 hybrid sensor histidine kinase/response regulator [Echinicola strongylocentroti]